MQEKEESEGKLSIDVFEICAKVFVQSRELMIAYLDEIYDDFVHGEDIHKRLENLDKAFPYLWPSLVTIIALEEKQFKNLLINSNLSEEEKSTITKLKYAYDGLKNPLHRFKTMADGVINTWTKIIPPKLSYNFNRGKPQVEFEVFSYDKRIILRKIQMTYTRFQDHYKGLYLILLTRLKKVI